MDFITNMMGLLLLIICIGIVLVFMKDYLKLGKAIPKTIKNGNEMIFYEIRYKNKRIDSGEIDMDELPVQFGRERGCGNDIIIAPDTVPEEDRIAVSSAWFYIQKDAAEHLVVYSADSSAGSEKRTSAKIKLIVDSNGEAKAVRSARLESELILKAGKFLVILSVQE